MLHRKICQRLLVGERGVLSGTNRSGQRKYQTGQSASRRADFFGKTKSHKKRPMMSVFQLKLQAISIWGLSVFRPAKTNPTCISESHRETTAAFHHFQMR